MKTREVFAVMTNTDLTEGRGSEYVKAYCDTSATAQRIGHKGYVQGSPCPVHVKRLFQPVGETAWFGPVKIEMPSESDLERQVKIDERSAALDKAIAAGLTQDEIKMIQAPPLISPIPE